MEIRIDLPEPLVEVLEKEKCRRNLSDLHEVVLRTVQERFSSSLPDYAMRFSIITTLYAEDREQERATYRQLIDIAYWSLLGILGIPIARASGGDAFSACEASAAVIAVALISSIAYLRTLYSLRKIEVCKLIRERYYREPQLIANEPFTPLDFDKHKNALRKQQRKQAPKRSRRSPLWQALDRLALEILMPIVLLLCAIGVLFAIWHS